MRNKFIITVITCLSIWTTQAKAADSTAKTDLLGANSAVASSIPVPKADGNILLPGSTDNVPPHAFSAQEEAAIIRNNKSIKKEKVLGLNVFKYRPYADYEKTGFLIMSSNVPFESSSAKLTLARNMPEDATLMIFTDKMADKDQIVAFYSQAIPAARIQVALVKNSGSGFWARDALPVPVLDIETDALTLVDAKYTRFEQDETFSQLFNATLISHPYNYEGGNFQASHRGDCMIVNAKPYQMIPDELFKEDYGCRQVIRLPYVDGIGHIDERARFIDDHTIVTDTPEYKDLLEEKGFKVYLLPKPDLPYATYVNSLIMNDRVVVPVFGIPEDKEALDVYAGLGLKPEGANSIMLSTRGQGSVHCITMTYPPGPSRTALLRQFNAIPI